MPSIDQLSERWFHLMMAGMTAVVGWLCYRSIAHDSQVQAIQYQISTLIQVQSNVIPPVIENSLRELREKTNADRELISKLNEIAAANRLELGYLREGIAKLQQENNKP